MSRADGTAHKLLGVPGFLQWAWQLGDEAEHLLAGGEDLSISGRWCRNLKLGTSVCSTPNMVP